VNEWRQSTWGEEVTLEYGKALRDYSDTAGGFRVFGTNGPIGWTDKPLAEGPGVILGRKGAYRGVHYSLDPFFVIDTAYYVVPKTDLEMRWLYYAIIHHRLGLIDDGSPIPSTTRAAVYPREIVVPLPDEQRAIAGVLGALDDKIEQNRRTARALERLARAIFRAWFVDFEPVKAKAAGATSFPSMPQPVFDALPIRFVDSDIGPVPEGWHAGRLGDVIEMHDSRRVPLSRREREQRKGSFRYYGAAGIVDYVDDYLFDGVFVLIGEDGTVIDDKDGPLVQYVWGQFWVNNHAHVLTGSNGISTEYLRVLLDHVNIRPFVTGAVQQKLNQGNLKSVPILVADAYSSAAFNDFISSLFAMVRQVHGESHVLESIRDYLLPRLLSGSVRVKVANA